MKKILFSSFTVLFAAAMLTSCNKEQANDQPQEGDLLKVTIIAGNPEAEPASKTEIVGTTPYWSVGDKIGVSDGESNNNQFVTAITERSTSAAFSGNATVGTYYAYYPYTVNGVGEVPSGSGNYGAKFDIPAIQNPTASSFDGAADVLVSKQFNVTVENPTISDLEFARLGAIVKLVLIDKESTMSGTQHPSSVSMTGANNLVGRVLVNMKAQSLGEPYYNQSKTVTANYTSGTQYAIDGTNATYFVVYPQTLAEGSMLTVTASTEGYNVSRDITIPAGGIKLEAGKITTLRIGLSAGHIVPATTGAALPFEDDMSWANNGSSDSGTDIGSTISDVSSGLYITGTKAYKGKGGLKLGTSSAVGSITTKELDLSGAFYIKIESGQYSTDAGTLEVTVDETKVITGGSMAGTNYVNIAAGTYTQKSKVIIATSAKRGYIYSVKIKSGEYAPDPVINVTSSNPMAVSNANDLHAIEYTISNPTAASISASANVAWIHDFDYTTPGEVCFEVDAQETDAPSRSGVITLSYTGAADVQVTVNQAAGPSSGGGTAPKELTFVLTSNPGGWPTSNSTTLTGYTYTLDEVDYTFQLKNIKCNSGYLMCTQPAVLGLPAIDGYKLVSVKAYNSSGCSTSTKVGISSSSSQPDYIDGGEIKQWSTTGSNYTYTLSSTEDNTVYYIYVTNKNAQITKLDLTYNSIN